MSSKPKFGQNIAHFLIIIAFVQAHALRLLCAWFRTCDDNTLDGFARQFHSVPVRSINGQADRHAMSFGQQTALNTAFGPVSGVRTGVFAAQGRFGHGPIHAQPGPIKARQLIKLRHTRLPQPQKDVGLNPDLIAIMCRRAGTQVGVVERFPLAASPQHIKNRIRALPIRDPRPSAPKAVRIHVDRQQWLQNRPQCIRNPKTGRGFVIGTSGTSSFGFTLCLHTPKYTPYSQEYQGGYSDR